MSTKPAVFDAIIVGAGIVGATLAALLGEAGKQVALIEARKPAVFEPEGPFDLRVSAINRASQQAFEQVGAWSSMVAMRAHAYEAMQVWDEAGSGKIRFDADEFGLPNLGHIIENRVIQSCLMDRVKACQTLSVFCPAQVASIQTSAEGATVSLKSGEQLRARLLVGADGPSSSVRELAGIDRTVEDYGQKGLVSVVKGEYGHQDTAWQRFLSGGPLALLPLNEGYVSIVWSLPADQADRYSKMPETEFCRLLSEASDYQLGSVVSTSERAAFPLQGAQASSYIAPGLALVGDAAHTIHPLAGQGVNLGVKDAVVLAEILLALNTRSWGSYRRLRQYERARQGENILAMKAMEGFKHLFEHDASLVALTRNAGLNLFNSMPMLKQTVMRHAMGL